ncbi:MAG: DEAD/DEAH box helicase family protein [Anaerolineae bacterium]|nr:DEAD/DEAH box helicase family protein [Anaerolineae bacterium]
MHPNLTPEQQARVEIDRQLEACGWQVQSRDQQNLFAQRGVAIREFPLKTGYADYLLCVDGKAIGAVEAKKAGTTLSGVQHQSEKYSTGLPKLPKAWVSRAVSPPTHPKGGITSSRSGRPGGLQPFLPFLYESTGIETCFTNGLDPEPRSRRVFTFHRPETLAEWAEEAEQADNKPGFLEKPGLLSGTSGSYNTLRARLNHGQPLINDNLWEPQHKAITRLEQSLAADKPRALIQMATGSGKTFTAVNIVYRLIKLADARRVLFLVDRGNLGRQALREFQQFVTPDDGRKFGELYNVQHLSSNHFDDVSRVCITTIQRLYSILRGEELDPTLEEPSLDELEETFGRDPKSVAYNPRVPIEFFDIIFIDECHRSIYNLWRQVLDYFDAHLIGLTATPSKQTFGFFNQNLVMEYTRQQAVADGINVDHNVYRIRTRITERGSTIEAGHVVPRLDLQTRQQRWDVLDEDLTYTPSQIDREVLAESQIRTIIRTFKERLPIDIFPGRREVPKTLIFAKDDAHAESIVEIVRDEFGRGNDFCQKITYKVFGVKPEDVIAAFRNSYNPRIAVTVDMIATGTDIKPIEILLFMRLVKSKGLFEQMLGRGTRVIKPTDLQVVTPDAPAKDRFVIVDAVGVVEHEKIDTQTLDRQPSLGLPKLLDRLANGADDADTLLTLASRLARLARKLTPQDEYKLNAVSRGRSLNDLAQTLLVAVDPDQHFAAGQQATGELEPAPAQVQQAAEQMQHEAMLLFAANEQLRHIILSIQQRQEQVIDQLSIDEVLEAGYDVQATSAAQSMVDSFRQYIEDNKEEITALQLIFNRPYSQQRLTFVQIQDLANQIQTYRPAWSTETLWQAYTQLERDKVRGANAPRVLTDLISLVRRVVQLEDELVPYPERVRQRYADWLAAQTAAGRRFSPQQQQWLDKIAETIGLNLAFTEADFQDYFYDEGGLLAARSLFGREALPELLAELNEALVV